MSRRPRASCRSAIGIFCVLGLPHRTETLSAPSTPRASADTVDVRHEQRADDLRSSDPAVFALVVMLLAFVLACVVAGGLEDGGEHIIKNLRARCCDCHGRKTAAENAARARARRPPDQQMTML